MKTEKQLSLIQTDPLIQENGALALDLCLSALVDPISAKNTFRLILKDLLGTRTQDRFQTYQRSWVLATTYRHILASERHKPKQASDSHILEELSASKELNPRLEDLRYRHYFFKLPVEDRIMLLLHYRNEISTDEIASALGAPKGSLEIRRLQSLRRLKEEIYGESLSATGSDSALLQKLIEAPKATVPKEVIENPHSKAWIKASSPDRKASKLSQWRRTPWYIRTSIEGLSVALMVFATIIAIPKLRSLYDRMTDRRLESYNLAELAPAENLGTQPAGPNHPAQVQQDLGDASVDTDEEESKPDSKEDTEIVSKGPVKIQEGEIWRFYIKTESPREMRSKIVALLQNLDLTTNTSDVRGKEAPGGIMFDLLLTKDGVLKFRTEIDKIAQEILKETGSANLALNQIYTWYRSRSKKPIPSGRTRIIIWLSQI